MLADITARAHLKNSPPPESPAVPPTASRPPIAPAGWLLVALLAATAAVGLAGWCRASRVVPHPTRHFSVDLGPDVVLRDSVGGPTPSAGPAVVLSPDGSRLAFAARRTGGASWIFTRRLDQLKAVPLDGTEGGTGAFFSPDGRWIGFFADGKLKKVSIEGGAPVSLCNVADPLSDAWGDDGWIPGRFPYPGICCRRTGSGASGWLAGKIDRGTGSTNRPPAGRPTQRQSG